MIIMKFESLKLEKFKMLKKVEMKNLKGGWESQGSRSYWCVNSFHDGVHSFVRDIEDDGTHIGYSPTVRHDGASYGSGVSAGCKILQVSSGK